MGLGELQWATMVMQNYRLTIAYDGTHFHGWQIQKNHVEGTEMRTAQGVLQDVLCRVMKQPVILTGASRTDSGVHAFGQTGQFKADTRIPERRIADAINSKLPEDLEVVKAEVVRDDFDPIRDAVNKQYRYRVYSSRRRPLMKRNYVFHRRGAGLDVEAMNKAAGLLVGEHDFAAFAATGHNRQSTVRTIYKCEVEEVVGFEDEVHIVVQGNGFLYNMVRIIAGTLVEVGRGHWHSEYMRTLFTEPKRELAGPTLPASGLCLEWIEYPDDLRKAKQAEESGDVVENEAGGGEPGE